MFCQNSPSYNYINNQMKAANSQRQDILEFQALIVEDLNKIQNFMSYPQFQQCQTQPQNLKRVVEANQEFRRIKSNLKKLVKFSLYLLKYGEQYCEKSQILAQHLAQQKHRLLSLIGQINFLEEKQRVQSQTISQQQQQIITLKCLNKLDISYASSIHFQIEEESQNTFSIKNDMDYLEMDSKDQSRDDETRNDKHQFSLQTDIDEITSLLEHLDHSHHQLMRLQ